MAQTLTVVSLQVGRHCPARAASAWPWAATHHIVVTFGGDLVRLAARTPDFTRWR